LSLLGACTAANAEVSAERGQGATGPLPVRAQTDSGSRAYPRASTASRAVFYDLAKHRDHAELRLGQTLLIDFGTSAAAKYTLGGWSTHMRPGADIDGVRAALVNGSYGDVIVPLAQPGRRQIRVRVRAPRDGSVVAYLGEQVVGRFKSKPDAFATLEIEVPDSVERTEHLLRLRATGIGRLGTQQSALALAWLSVGDGSALPETLPTLAGEGSSLRLPQGLAAGYGLRVPAGARLTAQVQGAGARLAVFAVDDAQQRSALGEFSEGKLDLDLSALAGRTVRLDLEARSALSLGAPRLEVTAAAAVAPRAAQSKPVKNVLVYLIDTLRADHLKAFNASTRVKTPGLDELVQKGSAVFASAHTQENWTKPSVATLLSSLFPWEHHAITTEAVVPAAVELLPERLGKLGFYTGAFIANGYVSDKFGFKQGWSTYRNYIREGRYSRAEFLAADVLEWLDKRPTDKPFMLYVHAIDPHVPYKPTAQFLSIYDPQPYDGVVDFKGDNELLEKIKIGSIKLKDRDKVHLEALYDSEISYHDLHFRTILGALDKRGLADDTMIVVVADHGEEFWDHGSVGHGHSVYEELLRIPMVIRVPGITASATRVASSSGLVDIVPTVFDVLGQKAPEGLSGRSLLPELRGECADAPPVAVAGFMDGWRTAIVGDLKLIQRTEKRFMVHDLRDDPHEQNDVAKQRPITTRMLRAQLGLALAKSQSEASRTPKAETTTIDKETEAQLKALGYVGSSRR
jgi:arylsulfatase A-like enzyme